MNQELKLRYVALLSGKQVKTIQEDVADWMRDVSTCLADTEPSAPAGDSLQLANNRALARHALITLSRRLSGIDQECREAIKHFAASLPQFVLVNQYKFTTYQFLPHAGAWMNALGHLKDKPGVSALEIGSLEGASACWLLDNILTHPSASLTCVDTFDLSGQSGLLDVYSSENISSVRQLFDSNIAATGRRQNVTVIQELSQVALRKLPLSSYDFIYIDGSHVAYHVIEDAVLAWRLLKPNGVLTFDDYLWGEDEGLSPRDRPQPAIDAFLDLFSGQYQLLEKGTQITVTKLQTPEIEGK